MELKFRAWIDGEMVYIKDDLYIAFFNAPKAVDWAIYNRKTDTCFYIHDSSYPELLKSNFLMLFTGLKDKNGRDIYVGDIVNIKAPSWEYSEYKNEAVGFDGRGFHPWTECSGQIDIDFVASDEPNDIEIVGNVFENPELLTK